MLNDKCPMINAQCSNEPWLHVGFCLTTYKNYDILNLNCGQYEIEENMKLSEKKIRVVAASPYAKEIKDFIRKLEELSKTEKLDYSKDSFWSIQPLHLGKTDSSRLDDILY